MNITSLISDQDVYLIDGKITSKMPEKGREALKNYNYARTLQGWSFPNKSHAQQILRFRSLDDGRRREC